MIEVRERHSERLTRARAAVEMRRGARPLLVSLVGFAIGLGCWAVVIRNVGKQVYTSTREISFAVQDASGVIGGGRQEVRFKGMQAGVISKVKRSDGRPVLTVKLYRNFGPVYRDARATLRPNTALEDMYLDILNRGTPRAGVADPDQPLAQSQTRVGVQPEDVLSAFQPDVRRHMALVLRNLGGGLSGRGESVRATFQVLVPFVKIAAGVAAQLEERATLTRRLVHDTAVLTGDLGDRDQQLRRLVRDGATTLRAVQASSGQLDATLARLPGTLANVDSSFTAVRGVLPRVDAAVRTLGPVAASLPDGLSSLRRFTAAADPAVRKLKEPVSALVPLAKALPPVTGNLRQALQDLRPQVPALDYATTSIKGCNTALQSFFQWTPSVMKYGDSRGYAVRGDAVVDLGSSGGVLKDPNTIVADSCAPGRPLDGQPGPGGSR